MTDMPTPDPFDVLRRPDAPIAPSAAFAKQLRQRLTAELQPLLARPTTTSTTASTTSSTSTPVTTRERTFAMSVTPYFSVRNCAAALDFYRDAFGAIESERLVSDDGRIGHAEITIGGSRLMLADEYPEVDAIGPQTLGGTTVAFDINVGEPEQVDETFARAIELGSTVLREPENQFYGMRNAVVQDPFGHRWTVSAPVEELSAEEYAARAAKDDGFGSFTVEKTKFGAANAAEPSAAESGTAAGQTQHDHQLRHHAQGDLYYFVLPTRDLPAAQRFYGAVLGWQFLTPDNGHIENISAPPGGLNPDTEDTGVRLWFAVDDIHAAVERVRANGGTAQDPVNNPSGWSSDCVDPQGTMFSLSVPAYVPQS